MNFHTIITHSKCVLQVSCYILYIKDVYYYSKHLERCDSLAPAVAAHDLYF